MNLNNLCQLCSEQSEQSCSKLSCSGITLSHAGLTGKEEVVLETATLIIGILFTVLVVPVLVYLDEWGSNTQERMSFKEKIILFWEELKIVCKDYLSYFQR